MRVLLLLLGPLWAGAWVPGFHSPFTSGCQDNNPDYQIQVNPSVTVQEGLCVLVTCELVKLPSSSWLGPVFGYWFRSGANTNHDSPVATNNAERAVHEETQGRFHLLGNPKNHSCSLDIRDAQRGDGGSYFFRVEKGDLKWNYCRKPVSVQVTALTHTPHVDIPPTLEPGHAINLTCSVPWACERGTPPIFSWMSAAPTSLGPRTTLSSVLTLTPRPQDHGANLTCQVTFPGARVTVQRTDQLSVTYAPQKLAIQVFRGNDTEPQVLHSGSSLRVQEGESLRLVCVADSNPPASLSWESLSPRLVQSSTPGLLQLPRVELADHGEYVCRAHNSLGSQDASLSLSVTSPSQLLGPSCSWEAEGLHCSCSSRAWPAPSLHWRLGEGLLEGNSSNTSFTVISSSRGPWVNSSLSLSRDIAADLKLSCEAQNEHGAQSCTVLLPGDVIAREQAEASMGAVPGAFLGAGIMALLTVCICLAFYIVKTYKGKLTRKVERKEGSCLAKTPVSTVTDVRSHLDVSGPDIKNRHGPAMATAISKEEPEIYYASLSFQGHGPWQPQSPEATTTEYAEIKTHKS